MSAKRARSDATTNVQLNAISSAPVTQAPFTAHTTGVVIARSVFPGLRLGHPAVPAATSLKSTPALNTGSTAVTMTTRVAASASASSISSHRRVRIAAVSAFLTSGRLIVIVRTPSASSTIRSSPGLGTSAKTNYSVMPNRSRPNAVIAFPRSSL